MTAAKLAPVPYALTEEEWERLARYTTTPDSAKSREELLDELRLDGLASELLRYRESVLIRRMLPAEVELPRGDFTEVANASRYTREYVSRIRHDKVATMRYEPEEDA